MTDHAWDIIDTRFARAGEICSVCGTYVMPQHPVHVRRDGAVCHAQQVFCHE